MNWFETGLLSGKIPAKKATILTNDWVELNLVKNDEYEYSHQGLEEGVYAVILDPTLQRLDQMFFVVSTGISSTMLKISDKYYEFKLTTENISLNSPTSVFPSGNMGIKSCRVKKIV